MNRYNDKLIQDKTLPTHNFITNELVKRKFITADSNFDMYLYDALFEELLLKYEFKTVIVTTNYIINKVMKEHNFCDENGNRIENVFAYFSTSIRFNLIKITGEIYEDIKWFDDD